MFVFVLVALTRTPFADFRTKLAKLFGKAATATHRSNAQFAYVRTLDATLGTVVGTFLPCHFVSASMAFNNTLLTGVNTLLESVHRITPSLVGVMVVAKSLGPLDDSDLKVLAQNCNVHANHPTCCRGCCG